jgi:hypothetical protein
MKPKNMQILTPALIEKIKAGFDETGPAVSMFEMFFTLVRSITGVDDISPAEFLREVSDSYEFGSAKEFERYAGLYFEYHNAVVALIESFNDNPSAKKVQASFIDIYHAFEKFTPENDSRELIKGTVSEFIQHLVAMSGVNIEKKSATPDMIYKKLGDELSDIFKQLAAIYVMMNESEASGSRLRDFFIEIMMCAYLLNEDRKDNFDPNDYADSEPYRKNPSVGRNEPCPCGSGKKYKKCCLEKDENPFCDLLPVNPPHARLNRDEIETFYVSLNIFMKHASALKNSTDAEKLADYYIINGKDIYVPNPEYMKDTSSVEDLFDFIRDHCAEIVVSCLNTIDKNSTEGSIIKSWRTIVFGDFFVLEPAPQGCAVFWRAIEKDENRKKKKNEDEMFLVYGLYDSIPYVIGSLPVHGYTILFPYRDRIVYNGIFLRDSISFKRELVNALTDEYIAIRKKKPVTICLASQ